MSRDERSGGLVPGRWLQRFWTRRDGSPDGSTSPGDAGCARWARYDLPLIFTMIAPSTIRSRNAIASGGSLRYSSHASKSMFVTSAVERCGLRALISLESKLAA